MGVNHPALRRAARAAAAGVLVFLNIGLAWRACSAFLPGLRGALDVSHVEVGEALRLAQHPRNGDPAARMPIGTLTEAAALLRLSPAALAAWGALLYGVVLLLVFALARELGGGWAGLAAAAVWQRLFLDQPFHSGSLKQFWLTGLGLLAACALVRHARRPGRLSASAVGAAFGLTVLTRSTFVFLPPILAACETLREGPPRRRLARAALLLGAFALILAPWTAMNASVKKRLQVVEYGAGDLNIVLGALGAVHGGEGDHIVFMDAPESDRGKSPIVWAVRTVLGRPARYLQGVVSRARYALGLKPWLFALALLGLLASRRDAGARAHALQCVYFLAIVCAMPVEASYFEPLWPLLLALATAPLSGLTPPPGSAAGARLAAGGVAVAALLGAAAFAQSSALALTYAVKHARRPPWSDAALDEVLARRPPELWASFEDARRRLRRGDAAGAIRVLESSSPALGGLPRHRLLLAWARAKNGDASSLLAIPDFEGRSGAAFNDGLGPALAVYQALALDAAGRRGAAIERMEFARKDTLRRIGPIHEQDAGAAGSVEPKTARRVDESFPVAVELLLAADDPADAARALELATAARPTFEGWHALGRALASRGRTADASRALKSAGALASGAEQLHRLHFRWAELGDRTRARRILLELTRRFPQRGLFWSDLGVDLYREGDAAGAEKAFRRALAEEPGLGAASLSLATILASRGESAEARRLCAAARPEEDEDLRARLQSCYDSRK